MILTLYFIGALITLGYYASGRGQKLYQEIKELKPDVDDKIIRISVRTSIITYTLLWFIFIPIFIITKSK